MASKFSSPPANSFGEAITAMKLYFSEDGPSKSVDYYSNGNREQGKLYMLAWQLEAYFGVAEGRIEEAIEAFDIWKNGPNEQNGN